MMIADLVDLEDFAALLRELGLALPLDADVAAVKSALEDWLSSASDEEIASFERLSAVLKDKSEGMVLPSVVMLIDEAHDYLNAQR